MKLPGKLVRMHVIFEVSEFPHSFAVQPVLIEKLENLASRGSSQICHAQLHQSFLTLACGALPDSLLAFLSADTVIET